MAYRSEAGKIGNKPNYQDLNLTQFPSALDSRQNNPNMRGFTNVGEEDIPDYIMAEYVNALSDAVMAVQRALGTNPMVPTNANAADVPSLIEGSNVSSRIGAIEGGLLDERYGGAGWAYQPDRPTLSKHEHTGTGGQPGKISLLNEIEGKLQKANLNLAQAGGLTAADLFVSATNSKRVTEALEDALSKQEGGRVDKPVVLAGGLRSRTVIECTAPEMVGGNASLSVDAQATASQARVSSGNTASTFHGENLNRTLLFGKYVVGVRVKVSNPISAALIRIQAGGKTTTYQGNEFAANTYKVIYHVFDHSSDANTLKITRLATTAETTVQVDSFFIQPIHPAVFDR